MDLYDTLGIQNPWKSLTKSDRLPFDGHGWFPKKTQEPLLSLLKKLQPRYVIELGSWLGSSTRFLATNVQTVIAIDHWNGSPEHQDREEHQERLKHLFTQFLSNCWDQRERIVPLRATTEEAFNRPLPVPGLIYVDADHSYDGVMADLERSWKILGKRGVLCGDDWNWRDAKGDHPVRQAVKDFAASRSKDIRTHGTFWHLQPKTSGPAYETAPPPTPKREGLKVGGQSVPAPAVKPARRKKGKGRAKTAREKLDPGVQQQAVAKSEDRKPVMKMSALPKNAQLKGNHDMKQGVPKAHFSLEKRKAEHLPRQQGSDKLSKAKVVAIGTRTQTPRPKNIAFEMQTKSIPVPDEHRNN